MPGHFLMSFTAPCKTVSPGRGAGPGRGRNLETIPHVSREEGDGALWAPWGCWHENLKETWGRVAISMMFIISRHRGGPQAREELSTFQRNSKQPPESPSGLPSAFTLWQDHLYLPCRSKRLAENYLKLSQ